MNVTSKLISVPGLLMISLFTYLRVLMYLIFVYFVPALAVLFFSMSVSGGFYSALSNLPGGFDAQAVGDLLLSHLTEPGMLLSLVLGLAVFVFTTIFVYVLTESLVSMNKLSLGEVFSASMRGVGKYIAAYAAYFGIIALYFAAPVALQMVAPQWAKPVVYILFLIAASFAVFFVMTSIFFSRFAVLRDMWPKKIFYNSYGIVKAGIIRLIFFVAAAGALTLGCSLLLNTFSGFIIELVHNFVPFDRALAAVPLAVIINGFTHFFFVVSMTVYFLNMDYHVNPDVHKEGLRTRASGGADRSMPMMR